MPSKRGQKSDLGQKYELQQLLYSSNSSRSLEGMFITEALLYKLRLPSLSWLWGWGGVSVIWGLAGEFLILSLADLSIPSEEKDTSVKQQNSAPDPFHRGHCWEHLGILTHQEPRGLPVCSLQLWGKVNTSFLLCCLVCIGTSLEDLLDAAHFSVQGGRPDMDGSSFFSGSKT